MAQIQSPYSWIELRLSAKDLPRMDVLSKSDPMAIVQLGERGQFVEIGRTECIKDDQSPTWHTPIRVQYKFEVNQILRVMVYDVDPDKLDFMGKAECSVADVVAARGNYKQVNLNNDTAHAKKAGVLMLKAEEIIDSNSTVDALTFSCRGVNLDKKDTFGKSDPYYNVFRCRSDGGEPTLVRKSEVIKNTLNPEWLPQRFSIQELCNGDYNRPLLFEVWDWDKHTKHDLIGTFRTTLQEILNGKTQFDVIHPEKQRKKKSYKNSGTFVFSVKVHNKVSFLNYLKNGVQLNFSVAVDFTASNGDPRKPGSLHYISSGSNEYQQAIAQIGTIVSPYDIDQKFPVYGFGGKYRGQVNHCFPLNGNDNNPEVEGLPGIMSVYSEAIYKYELYGPTLFQSIIAETAKQATVSKNSQGSRNYIILLILTDGQINDMDQTILQVIRASSLPMSIIIVGVGSADFDSMETLDSDNKKLAISGQTAARDIVQFVPFSRFKSNPELLANETLAEVPKQVCEYYRDIMAWEPPLQTTVTTVTTTTTTPTTVAPSAYMAPVMQFMGMAQPQYQQYAPQPGYPQQQYAYPPQQYYPPQPQPGQSGVVAQPQPGVVAQPQPGTVGQPQPGQPGTVAQPQPGVVAQPQPGQPGVVVPPGTVAQPQPGQPQQYAYPPQQPYYYPPLPGQPGVAQPQPGQPGTVAQPQPGQPQQSGVVAQPQPGTVAQPQPGVVAQPQPGQPGTVAQPQPGQPPQQYAYPPQQGYYYPPQQYAYPPQQPQPGQPQQPGVVAQPQPGQPQQYAYPPQQPGVVAQPQPGQPGVVAQPTAQPAAKK